MRLTTTIALVATLTLAGCFGSGGGGSSAAPVPTIVELGTNYSVLVGASGPFDLVVSGTNGTVTVAPNQRIRYLTISGPVSDVFIGSSTTVAHAVILSGTNAVLHLPAGSPITATITGVGAVVVYDSSAG